VPNFRENGQFRSKFYDPFHFLSNLPHFPRKLHIIKYSVCYFRSDLIYFRPSIFAEKCSKNWQVNYPHTIILCQRIQNLGFLWAMMISMGSHKRWKPRKLTYSHRHANIGLYRRLIKKRVPSHVFFWIYIAPFWYQQEAQEPGFLTRKDRRGNLCIQRGEFAVFDQIYGKVSRSPYLLSALDHITMLFCAI
jgi:hypothetical protein